jgi:hypothetical protein
MKDLQSSQGGCQALPRTKKNTLNMLSMVKNWWKYFLKKLHNTFKMVCISMTANSLGQDFSFCRTGQEVPVHLPHQKWVDLVAWCRSIWYRKKGRSIWYRKKGYQKDACNCDIIHTSKVTQLWGVGLNTYIKNPNAVRNPMKLIMDILLSRYARCLQLLFLCYFNGLNHL